MFGKEITIMLYEIDQFNLDIANIKKDLEIEDIVVTEEDRKSTRLNSSH